MPYSAPKLFARTQVCELTFFENLRVFRCRSTGTAGPLPLAATVHAEPADRLIHVRGRPPVRVHRGCAFDGRRKARVTDGP